jgi:vanadium chloroperoxidase
MDQILYWNEVALEANRISHTEGGQIHKGVNGPTLSSRALAIIHLAMYDAFVGVSRANGTTTLQHYLPSLNNAIAGASENAAIAAAAHATLSKLYPNLKPLWDKKHLEAGLSSTGYEYGYEYGKYIAAKIWAERKNDPSDSDDGYAISVAKGKHRQDPNNTQPINAPFYGAESKCMAVTQRWGLKPPPQPGTLKYNAAIKQVRGKGIKADLMGTLPTTFSKRTVDETVIGIYWGYDGAKGLGTPPPVI